MKSSFTLIAVILSFNVFSQNKIPKRITADFIYQNDTTKDAVIKTFNSDGLPTSEIDNRYYYSTEYKYDEKNRLAEKIFLYGESFGNGSSFYTYDENSVTEKTFSGGYYSLTKTEFNQNRDTLKQSIIFFGGYLAMCYSAEVLYFYDNNNRLIEKKTLVINKDFDFEKDSELHLEEEKIILKKFKKMEIIDSVQTNVKYKYNSYGLISEMILSTGLEADTRIYTYNEQKQLTQELHKNNYYDTRIITNRYSETGNLQNSLNISFVRYYNENYEEEIYSDTVETILEYSPKNNLIRKTQKFPLYTLIIKYNDYGFAISEEYLYKSSEIPEKLEYKYEYYE